MGLSGAWQKSIKKPMKPIEISIIPLNGPLCTAWMRINHYPGIFGADLPLTIIQKPGIILPRIFDPWIAYTSENPTNVARTAVSM